MADDLGMGATAQNVSPWVTHRTNSRLLEAQLKYNTLDRLLKEASALAPDTQKLSEDILKYKTSAGDKTKFSSQLNGLMNDYLTKYQENPFYAFTREGKESARQMQRVANHPMLGTLEAMNEKAQKLYDDVVKSGNASKVNVKNGLVNVYDHSKNKFDWVNPDSIDYNTHEVLTAGDAITKKLEKGFYDPSNPYKLDDLPEVTMTSYDNVLTNLNRILEGIGSVSKETLSSDIEGLQSQLTETDKSNLPNIQMKAKAIFSKAGLPPDYWDTLLSNVYSSYKNGNLQLPTSKEATAEVLNSVNNIIYSRLRTTEDLGGAGKKGAGASGVGSEKTVGAGKYTMFINGQTGAEDQVTFDNSKPSVPAFTLSGFFNHEDDNKVNSTFVPLSQNKVFNSFALPNSELTTLNGTVLNKALVLPAQNSSASLVRIPGNDKAAWLVFDAYIEEEAGTALDKELEEVSSSEDDYLMNLEDTLKKLGEENPNYIYGPSNWTFDGDYYKGKVRVMIDIKNAEDNAIYNLDKKELYIPKGTVTVGDRVTTPNRIGYTGNSK